MVGSHSLPNTSSRRSVILVAEVEFWIFQVPRRDRQGAYSRPRARRVRQRGRCRCIICGDRDMRMWNVSKTRNDEAPWPVSAPPRAQEREFLPAGLAHPRDAGLAPRNSLLSQLRGVRGVARTAPMRPATSPRSAWTTMAGRSRALFASRNATQRHDFGHFLLPFPRYPGRVGIFIYFKCHSESGLNQRDEAAPRVCFLGLPHGGK